MFSKTCEYGIRAVVYIMTQSRQGKKMGVKEIAAEIDAPEFFTAKILQALAKKNVISSGKGPNGGFYIDKDQEDLKLIDLIIAIDGDRIFTGCALGLKYCSSSNPCPIHNEFKVVRDLLEKTLSEKSIKELAQEVVSGNATLARFA